MAPTTLTGVALARHAPVGSDDLRAEHSCVRPVLGTASLDRGGPGHRSPGSSLEGFRNTPVAPFCGDNQD